MEPVSEGGYGMMLYAGSTGRRWLLICLTAEMANLGASRMEAVAAGHLGMISRPDELAERLQFLIEAAR